MSNNLLCVITALFIFDLMIRSENLHVHYLISYSLLAMFALNFRTTLRLRTTLMNIKKASLWCNSILGNVNNVSLLEIFTAPLVITFRGGGRGYQSAKWYLLYWRFFTSSIWFMCIFLSWQWERECSVENYATSTVYL